MAAARHERIQEIFCAALDLDVGERAAFVANQSAGDDALMREILSLLEGVAARAAGGVDHEATRVQRRRQQLVEAGGPQAAHPGAGLPERIGPYVVKRCLGEGGMGVVYEAEQVSPRRRVAVKVLRPASFSPGLAARFHREVELLGRLEHPGIARIYEAGQARPWGSSGPEVPYLVMELVEGELLTTHAARAEVSIAQKLELLARTCDAVQHAHERGVIHRDLKPANLLVDAAGHPHVLDFGVARALDAEMPDLTAHTGTSQMVGTLPYMSPEQLAGRSEEVGPRSDVYALGVIAYEMLTGRRPLPLAGLSLGEAIRHVQEVDPPSLSMLDARLTGDVEAIVAKALEKEPARRFESAAAMADDLRRHLAEEPILARPPSAIHRATKFVRRNRAVAGATIVVFAVLVAALAVTGWLAAREVRARRRADVAAAEALRAVTRAELGGALAALEDSDVVTAREHLERAPEALRGWGWRHVAARLDDALAVVRLAGPATTRRVRLQGRADGMLLALGDDELTVLRRTEDDLRAVRVVEGEFHALSADGSHALEHLNGEWRLHDLVERGPARPVGPALEATALGLESGGFVIASPPGLRVLDSSGDAIASWPLTVPERGFMLLAASAGDQWLALHGEEALFLVSLRTGASRQLLRGAAAVAFTQDGRLLLAVDDERRVHAFPTSSPGAKPWPPVQVSSDHVDLLAVAAPAGRFVTVDQRGEVRVWDLARPREQRAIASLGYFRHEIALRSDGAAIALGDSGGALRAFTLDGAPLGTPRLGHGEVLASILWLESEDRIATLDRTGELRLFLAPGRRDARRLEGHASYVYGVAAHPSGTAMASIAWDGTARVWDSRDGAPIAVLDLPDRFGRAACWTSDGALVTVQGASVTTWDVAAGQERARVDGLAGPQDVACGRTAILIALESGRLLAWQPGRPARTLVDAGRRGAARVDVSSATGLAAYSIGSQVLVIDPQDGREAARFSASSEILRVAFTPDGSHVMVAGRGGFVGEWTVDGVPGRTWQLAGGASVMALAVHPDGRTLFLGSQDATITLLDLDRGDILARLEGHGDYVHDIALAPNGSWLGSASGDTTVRLWDTLPLKERLQD